jgi:ABC-type nickel/cobalt efflux system permease component RcnA
MNSLVAIQHWLYGGMASGLGEVAGGDLRAIFAAMAAAVLFGAVHALMPGHGKTVLVSYHLGQPAKLREGIANGAILALTHVGLALLLVLAGFAVISRAFAYGGRTPQFETASGVLITLIGAFLLWRPLRSDPMQTPKTGRPSLS